METDRILTLYFLRHQESVQNKYGFGKADTHLTEQGRERVSNLSRLVSAIGVGNIDHILTGTLQRHHQTLGGLLERIGYHGEIIPDERLNALFSGPLLELPAAETERRYQLDRVRAGSDGLCAVELPEGRTIHFDPAKEGIYPFDPLYCGAYFDKGLRQAVFPHEPTLPSFHAIAKQARNLQGDIIRRANESPKPMHIVAISSCSPSGFNLEYATFGTVGKNMRTPFGSEGNPVFPQNHDELMVLGYTRDDASSGRKRLRAIEGNVNIDS